MPDQLISISSDPPNAETPLSTLSAAAVPNDLFYLRCNFPMPAIDAATWALTVDGSVAAPKVYNLADLRALPFVRSVVTMECAGNGRTLMDPVPPGTPWGLGAVSVAEFGGVALRDVLAAAAPASETIEVVFTGADHGVVEPEGDVPYAFSLPLDEAIKPGPILAWEMNRRPLPAEHGSPLRLVVPGSYGMRSVKWLTRITAIERPFDGHFIRKYRYFGDADEFEGTPVTSLRIRSLILQPADGDTFALGKTMIHGIAWSGAAPVAGVDVDYGAGWLAADVAASDHRHGPATWSLSWIPNAPGPVEIRARARDRAGDRQPLRSRWNANGYANNVVHRILVVVAPG